jgi:hypothetical protein
VHLTSLLEVRRPLGEDLAAVGEAVATLGAERSELLLFEGASRLGQQPAAPTSEVRRDERMPGQWGNCLATPQVSLLTLRDHILQTHFECSFVGGDVEQQPARWMVTCSACGE